MQSWRSCSNSAEVEINKMKIKENNIKWITLAVLAVAVVMIVAGIINGEPSIVLTKAKTICLQCIGID